MKLGEIINRYNHLQNITDEEVGYAISALKLTANGLEELGAAHQLSLNEVRRIQMNFERIVAARGE